MLIKKISGKAPAKVNMFLHIYEKRSDSYHDIDTFFQLIGLFDDIDLSIFKDHNKNLKKDIENVSIIIENPKINIKKELDLCYKASIAFFQFLYNKKIPDAGMLSILNTAIRVNIEVNKNIPDRAGLGGGSSDAATVLILLNSLFNNPIKKDDLLNIAKKIGADVPIFIHGKSSFACGIGDLFYDKYKYNNALNKIPINEKKYKIIIVEPEIKLKTVDIFSSKLLTKRVKKSTIPRTDFRLGENDFTNVVFCSNKTLENVYNALNNVCKFHLTGTGSCLFSIVPIESAEDICLTIKNIIGVKNIFLTDILSNYRQIK